MKSLASNVDFNRPSFYPLGLKRPARESKNDSPLTSGYFTDIGSFSVKNADGHKHAAYHNRHFLEVSRSMTLNDLKPQNRVFSASFVIFGCRAHFKGKLR